MESIQIAVLEWISTIIKKQKTKLLYEPDNRFQPAEERIRKLEDKTIEDTKSEEKNEGKAPSGLMGLCQTD